MQRARSLQKTNYKCHKVAMFARLFFISAANWKKQDFCFLEEGEASKNSLLQCKESVKIALHTKTEKKNVNKKVKLKPFMSQTMAQKFDQGGTST